MKAILLLIIVFVFAGVTLAQTVVHPTKGSTERTELLDSLRPTVENELKQKIVFVINTISVQGSWAFIDGRLQTTDGKVPSWKGTKYADAAKYGAQSYGISALLKRSGSSWRVIAKIKPPNSFRQRLKRHPAPAGFLIVIDGPECR